MIFLPANCLSSLERLIHVVTPAEEDAAEEDVASGNPLRKFQPLNDHMKAKCFEFYQPRKAPADGEE